MKWLKQTAGFVLWLACPAVGSCGTTTYTLSDIGRPTAVNGTMMGVARNYASEIKYAPKLNAGGVQEKRKYDWLFQLTESDVTRLSDTQRLLRLTLGYGAFNASGNPLTQAGNLITQSIETGSQTFAQAYRYDAANRLRLAVEGNNLPGPAILEAATCAQVPANAWCVRYGYDGFGNAWTQERTGTLAAGLLPAARTWYAPDGVVDPANVTNRLRWSSSVPHYDAAGNQLLLEPNNQTRVAAYDAEGRLRLITDGASTVASYFYDGEGRRVRRNVGSASVWYVYGIDGQVLAEYQSTPAPAAGTEFLLTDHLGSSRVKFNSTNQVTGRWDYEPFGGELARTGDGYSLPDPLAQRFTGKERDPETLNSNNRSGLDYFGARYMSATMGRFTSPDLPFADQHTEDPQSWNLYSYVRNNPLRYTDPTGRCLRPNETLASCGDYLIGGAKAIGNIPSDIVNAPNRLTNLLISPFTDFQFPDLLPSTFQDANSDQAQGMEAMQVSLAVTPAAEAAAGKLAGMGQGARTAEVVIDSAKSPQAAAHIKDAQAAGQPSVVTLDRSLARPNRKAALADTPAAPKGSGLSRDEYPPACCREGGAGSSVRVISGRDNSSAGAQFGNQVRQLPDGTKVRIKVK